MKVLFLDIDGVLNTKWSRVILSLSRKRMTRLRKIIKETGCELVLSSTWRKDPYARVKLNKARLKFYGMTEDFAGTNLITGEFFTRGHEIQKFLDDHSEITKYVIVDDTDDMLESQQEFFVRTDFDIGMTEEDMYKIIELLNK